MNTTSPTEQTGLLVGVAAAVSLGVVFLSFRAVPPFTPVLQPRLTVLLQVKLFLATFTTLLLAVLLVNYAQMYREIPNRFTLSLLLFSLLLCFYAVTSNPLVPLLFGFRMIGVGPFTYLPDLFTNAAVIVLLHQSLK